jgi:outer membrane lipoprotein LolB
LGFELPIEHLKFWLLGVPDPHGEFELTRNAQDRAQHLSQAGWSIDYDRYQAASGDVLPGRVVLVRDDVRVRIVADRWTLNP